MAEEQSQQRVSLAALAKYYEFTGKLRLVTTITVVETVVFLVAQVVQTYAIYLLVEAYAKGEDYSGQLFFMFLAILGGCLALLAKGVSFASVSYTHLTLPTNREV